MTKENIEVELPEGWKAVAYRLNTAYDYIFDQETGEIVHASGRAPSIRLIVERIQPRRIVLEETDITNAKYKSGFFATQPITFKDGIINLSDMENLWREVKENS